ncbi:O-antigen ligase family protein [Hufsiella ginkgonis]|uniref:O-antigen ligase-related domain-containing protein n=1 Tax=Hufsiella ginkgonis TaxID=2695274 RepID=A0A7K1XXQ8_9SPHI|nr:O-antigen ligase family protein [Hufsiella ginkgonis]MXV15791.1 hypothetical protein [Hufsiella ginkgonis]
MPDKLIIIMAGIVLILFFLTILYKGSSVRTCLLFILSLLPLMNLKITPEALGGFKTLDVICLYAFIFLFKDFTTINLRSRNNGYFALFMLFGIAVLIGGLMSEFPGKAFLGLFKILPVFVFGRFLVTECLKDRLFINYVIRALKISYLTALGFLILQVIFGLKFTFYPELGPNTVDTVFHIIRYPGVFYDPQAHGQYLAMGSFLFLYVEQPAGRKRVFTSYAIFALAVIAIVLAGSRAAFGGFAAGLLLVIFMAGKQFRILGSAMVVTGLLAYVLVSSYTGVFDRAKNLSDDYLFRQSIWKEAFQIFQKHPYLGIGSGNYQDHVMIHAQGQYLEIEEGKLVYFDQPENGYLKILVELGLAGFSIFLVFMLLPAARGVIYAAAGIFDKRIVFLVASLLSWMVAFNTVYSIYDTRILLMMSSMTALLIAYPKKSLINYEPDH